jgi:hypothetical protein
MGELLIMRIHLTYALENLNIGGTFNLSNKELLSFGMLYNLYRRELLITRQGKTFYLLYAKII